MAKTTKKKTTKTIEEIKIWNYFHTCPICGTPAPEIYDDEAKPSWECDVCKADMSDQDDYD